MPSERRIFDETKVTAHKIPAAGRDVSCRTAFGRIAEVHPAHDAAGIILLGRHIGPVFTAADDAPAVKGGFFRQTAGLCQQVVFRVKIHFPGHGSGDAAHVDVARYEKSTGTLYLKDYHGVATDGRILADGDLKIEVEGDSSFTTSLSSATNDLYGIQANGTLTISGTGKLTVTANGFH